MRRISGERSLRGFRDDDPTQCHLKGLTYGFVTNIVQLAREPVELSTLSRCDVIDVIAVPVGDSAASDDDELDAPTVLARTAKVQAVTGERSEGTRWAVSLLVDDADAARVAAYSAAGRVAVVQTSLIEAAEE